MFLFNETDNNNGNQDIAGDQALSRNDYFISKVSRKYVFSSVLSMVFLYAGSLIDTLIVGAFLSEDGLAAMSLVSPVYLVYYTVGAVIGIGTSIEASRLIGKGNLRDYRGLFTAAMLIMTGSALIMTVIGYVFLTPISNFLAGNETQYQDLVRQYLMSYLPGGAFTLLMYIPLYFLKIEGKPRASSILFFVSAGINVLLSWFFMCPVCNMGIGGAGLATSISCLVTAAAGFIVLLGPGSDLKFDFKNMKAAMVKSSLSAGIPNGLSNLLESARILLVNMLLIHIGHSLLLSCFTVVRNVTDILWAIAIGISSGLLPLIGVFFGERDYVSERATVRYTLKMGLIIMIPLTIFVCCIPNLLLAVFNVTDPNVIAEGRFAIPLACIGTIAAYVNLLYTGYLTAIKQEKLAIWVVALRMFIVLALFAFPLASLIGPVGIWISLSLTEVVTLIICIVVRQLIRKKNPSLDRYLLNKSKEPAKEINFSVKNDLNDVVFASTKISEFCEIHELDMKRSMRVSLAIEEILAFLITYCIGTEEEQFIDMRIVILEEEVMMRFRYVGDLFDLVSYYNENEANDEMAEELLGLKLILKSAEMVDFRKTLGTNNLMILY